MAKSLCRLLISGSICLLGRGILASFLSDSSAKRTGTPAGAPKDVKPTKLRHLFDLPRPDGKAARQVPQGPYAPGVIEHPPIR